MPETIPTFPGEGATAQIARRSAYTPVTAETMSDDEIRRAWRIASALAASGMFKIEKEGVTAEQAFAKMLIGRDLGISATQSLMTIDLVRGNVQMRAVLLASFVRKSEDYDYEVKEHTEEACEVHFTYRGRPAGESRYTMADATKAGLTKPSRSGEPSMYAKHPRNMLWARAMSNGVRWYCPDLTGGIPVYTEADTFEGTASEIGTGHGDGSEPGWGDTSVESAVAVERIIERARALGHASLSDRATAQMTLSGQPDSVVAMWCERTMRELDEFERLRVQRDDEDERWQHAPDAPDAQAPAPEALREQLGQVLDRIAAEEEAGADDAVMASLYAEQERLEGLLGDEPGDEQTEIPL